MTHTPICAHCGTVFEASRSDATYCRDACRTAARWTRERRNLREHARLVGALRRLSDAVLDGETNAGLVALAADARRALSGHA